VDIYLPDLKYADSDAGFQYSKVRDYTLHARAAIKEMHRQMGDALQFDENGLLRSGLLIRLLVLPNDIAGLEENLRWIRDELGPKTAISLMAQYYATNKAAADDRYILLSRRISEGEWFDAVSLLEELGMEEGFMQEYESASYYYRPDFEDAEKPFRDIRDFT
jgi:putative pyruvate formate lyase activating enzyme